MYLDSTFDLIVLDFVGKDATESFEDIGHSEEARYIIEKYRIGELDEAVSGITREGHGK